MWQEPLRPTIATQLRRYAADSSIAADMSLSLSSHGLRRIALLFIDLRQRMCDGCFSVVQWTPTFDISCPPGLSGLIQIKPARRLAERWYSSCFCQLPCPQLLSAPGLSRSLAGNVHKLANLPEAIRGPLLAAKPLFRKARPVSRLGYP